LKGKDGNFTLFRRVFRKSEKSGGIIGWEKGGGEKMLPDRWKKERDSSLYSD
jgi:hypothetical protein